MHDTLKTSTADYVRVDELVPALGIKACAVRKAARKGRFGPAIAGAHIYDLTLLAPADRDRVLARREAVHRRESVEALQEAVPVEPAPLALISLTDHQQKIARARADLCLWIANCQKERGLNRQQAVTRAQFHALENRDCKFIILLGEGQKDESAITLRNVENWLARWRPHHRHDADDHNFQALADLRVQGAAARCHKTPEGDPRYWHRIALLYEHTDELTLVAAWQEALRVGRLRDWGAHPQYHQVKYWYRRRKDRADVTARRQGAKFIYNVIDTPNRRDWSGMPPGSMWYADHHLCNNYVAVPKRSAPGFYYMARPTLTIFLDCPSTHIVGYTLRAEKGDGDVILTTWQRAVNGLGWCAETIVFDNGKDYSSIGGKPKKHFSPLDTTRCSNTGAILGVRVSFKLPFNARSSPCEMWFAQMARFEKSQPAFSGENIERHNIIWPTLAREKLAVHGGDISDPVSGCLVNPHLISTLGEYIAAFDRWLNDEREKSISDGIMLDGTSPELFWRAHVAHHVGKPVPPDIARVAFMRAFQKPQVVQKGSVVVFRRGESSRSWIRYHSHALDPYLISGEEVLVKIDVQDVSHAYVFRWLENQGWQLIDCGGPHGGCPSRADIPAGTGTELVREAVRANNARRKQIRQGINAEEQEAAFDEMRRSGTVRSDATDTEIVLTNPTAVAPQRVRERVTQNNQSRNDLREAFAEVPANELDVLINGPRQEDGK